MLNYIYAELYKVTRRKYFYVALSAVLLLESTFALELLGRTEFSDMVRLLCALMMVGPFLAVLCADLVLSDQYKAGALKNEVSFGIPRGRIYLGKLFAALLVALLLCFLVFAFYLGGAWIFAGHSDKSAERESLAVLAYVVAASFPLWLGTLGLSHCLFIVLKNTVVAGVSMVLFLAWGGVFLELFSMLKLGAVSTVAGVLAGLVPTTPFSDYHGALTWSVMLRHWAVGLGWFAVSSTLGMTVFSRREL